MIEKIKKSWLVRQFSGLHWLAWYFLCIIICSVGLILSWKFGGIHYYLWDYGNDYYCENECHRVVKECVPPYIDSYASDSLYIIIKQYPRGGWGIQPIYHKNRFKYSNGTRAPYYWIIDKHSEEILGPLDLQTFESECNRLDIHLKLKKL